MLIYCIYMIIYVYMMNDTSEATISKFTSPTRNQIKYNKMIAVKA